jgi:hypothetical protein
MARTRVVTESITCDSCGSETTDPITVILGWGKDQWELDLCANDEASLSMVLGAWIEKGRKLSRKRPRSASSTGDDVAAVRAWALANNLKVASKGRVSAEVRKAYAAANHS